MKTNYISIRSILFDLIQLVDERYWNESRFAEWATKAYRTLRISNKYVERLCPIELVDHKATLPLDFHREIIIFDKKTNKALHLASTLVGTSACVDRKSDACMYQYTIDENLVLTSNLSDTTLMIEYLAYPLDDDGYHLIPDNEVVKEAITAYVLWKYWLSKYLMKEEGSESRVNYFKTEWSIQSKKALSLNAPDIPEMENIKNRWNHLVPRERQFDTLFSTLNSAENVRH